MLMQKQPKLCSDSAAPQVLPGPVHGAPKQGLLVASNTQQDLKTRFDYSPVMY